MKKFLVFLIGIFILGILCANAVMINLKDSQSFLSMEAYREYANSKVMFKDVFWSVLYERVRIFGVFGIVCFTPVKRWLAPIVSPVFSFVWGFFLMSCIVGLGVVGLVVGLASVLPHGVLYAITVFQMINVSNSKRYLRKETVIQHVSFYIFMMLIFVTACVIETLIATHFIPWVIRLSFI